VGFIPDMKVLLNNEKINQCLHQQAKTDKSYTTAIMKKDLIKN
jgi:hypothetical protein